MGRPDGSIGCALTVMSCLTCALTLAAEPTPDEANTALTAVTKRPSYVFASTPDGLFRAPQATRRWERLKTPPEMPPNGHFAGQPDESPLVIYVAHRPLLGDGKLRPGFRNGLYVSRDDGVTWEGVSERDDFGATLLLPDGALFAVTGGDEINGGDHLLRSTDLGQTWHDITNHAGGGFKALTPDPDHPGLVRIHANALRAYTLVADDASYGWRTLNEDVRPAGRRPRDEFFARDASSSTTFYVYQATLANYFAYAFGNSTSDHAIEVVPGKKRFEFAHGARVVVPIRVVFHFDPSVIWPASMRGPVAGAPAKPKPLLPTIKFADQPRGTDFWGLRVESSSAQVEKIPSGRDVITMTVTKTPDGKTSPSTYQPPRVKYQVFNLSPTKPYARELDLSRFFDFSKPGEYHVQIIYTSGGHPDQEKGEWDGSFTSPVFTVVIRG